MVYKNIFKDLFIFEMVNSHQDSVEHGINIIQAMSKVANTERSLKC